MSGDRKFAAFISYSHKDEAFARWLHRALETYQPPKGLLAPDAQKRPAAPVFRDADELSASSDLTSEIREALDRSNALVVICSPNSAQSLWVAREIEYFRETGKGDRIFPIIAAGEPNAAIAGDEALPELLRARADGHEALAADARGPKPQKRTALLKLVAGLLGLSLGDLVDRDAQHRRKRLIQTSVAAGLIATIVGVLTTAWIAEANRSAAEARNRLMGEMRQAFEVEDAPRAIAALSEVWPKLSSAEQASHRAVLSAWLNRFENLQTSLNKIPGGQVFVSGRRLFMKDADSVRALALDDSNLALPTADGLVAVNGAGQLIRLQSDGSIHDLTPKNASIWAKYRWREATQFPDGLLGFSGVLQSASAGGATPALLFVNPEGGAWRLIEQGYLDQPKLKIDVACKTIGFFGKAGDHPNVYVAGEGAPLSFTLDTFTASATPARGPVVDFDGSRAALEALAKACQAKPLQSSDPDARIEISMPTLLETEGDWRAAEVGEWAPQPATLDYLYSLGQFVQRGKFEIPRAYLQETSEAYDAPDTRKAMIAGEFNGFDFTGGPTQSHGAVGAFWAASGAQYGLRFICATPAAAEKNAQVRCIDIRYHGDYGAVRIFDDWVYVQDMAYAGHPMFFLVRRSDLRVLRMNEPVVQGVPGGAAGAVALSPSGKTLVIAADDQFWRFNIGADKVTFAGKFDAAGLSGAGSDDDGVEAGSIGFIDETRIVTSRRDGLTFATDLRSDAELWRMRLRPTEASKTIPAHIIAAQNGRIAIIGPDFAALLDAQTGLPLAPIASVFHYDRGVTTPEIPAEPVDHSCPESSRRDACMSSRQLATAVMEAEQTNRPRLIADANGFVLHSSDGALATEAPEAPNQTQDWKTAPCRTGWKVEKGRIVRFAPLLTLAPNTQAPLAKFATCESLN